MRRFRKLPSCPKAHPFTKMLYEAMNRKRIGVLDLADLSGVNKNTITKWRTRDVPQIEGLRACLEVVGMELRVVPKGAEIRVKREGSRTWPPGAVLTAAQAWAEGKIVLDVLEAVGARYPEIDEMFESTDSGFKEVRERYPEFFPPRAAARARP